MHSDIWLNTEIFTADTPLCIHGSKMKIKGRDKQESLSGLRHFKKIGEIIWYSNGSSLWFGLILIRGEMCGCRFPDYCGVTGWIVSDGPSPTESYYDEIQTRMADNPVSSVSRASPFNLSPLKITPETPPQARHHTNNNNNAAAAGHRAIFCFWPEPALDPFYYMTLHRIYFETHW